MATDDMVFGLGESNRGINKRGYLYESNCSDDPNHTEDKISLYGCTVMIENDGKCAALAEKWRGSLMDIDNGAVIVLGTGVAGGLILNGELYRGRHFTAGEYSFMIVNARDTSDLNNYWGFDNGIMGLINRVAIETGWEADSLDGLKIFEEANADNSKVLHALDEYTKALAIQIYNLVILLDLDQISIGGGISQQALLLEMLQKNYDLFLATTPMNAFNQSLPTAKITNCKFYNDANLIGALYHFLKNRRKTR